MSKVRFALLLAGGLLAAQMSAAQETMTNDELTALTKDGRTIILGGPAEGYSGKLVLKADGTGKGKAKTDAGKVLTLTGKWRIADGKFCRAWKEFDGGKEVCEVWKKTSGNSADVYMGKNKIGVNSW